MPGRWRSWALLIASSLGLAACAGTWVSSPPLYPDTWPALMPADPARPCPDLSGTYQAVSDEVGPLVYPPGGHPRDMFFLVSYGPPKAAPQRLGRRLLPFHLAGAFRERDTDTWRRLNRYAAALDTEVASSAPQAPPGWVRVAALPDGRLEVRAGIAGDALIDLSLRPQAQGWWTYSSGTYECEAGALAVIGSFPPPPQENPSGQGLSVGAKFTFFRASDGSLVALEAAHTGTTGGNMEFKKWWRWRPLPP